MSREKQLVRTESEWAYWRRTRHSPKHSNKLVVLTGGNGKKKGSARKKEGHNNNKIGVLWAWDTDRIQAGEVSARGDGERGTLTKMPQQDCTAHGCGSRARCSCDLSTLATGNGHREGQSPECSNKLAVLTSGKGKKQPAREKGHHNNTLATK